jgi:hypothetical protein
MNDMRVTVSGTRSRTSMVRDTDLEHSGGNARDLPLIPMNRCGLSNYVLQATIQPFWDRKGPVVQN